MSSAPVAQRSSRFQSLDHWRGLACLLVVVYHSTIVHLATWDTTAASAAERIAAFALLVTHEFNLGVALFFVISGYCISAAADSARRRRDTVRWYFVRRFRRIYPPFWIVLACSVLLFFVVDYGWSQPLLSAEPWRQLRPWWYSPSQWLGNITLTETWRHYIFGSGRGHFPPQAWTLCYEEQFYFITGLLLALCPTFFFAGAAVVSALTVVIVVGSQISGVPVAGFFFDGSWLLFAAGVLAYYQINYARGLRAVVTQLVLIAGMAFSWLIAFDHAIAGFSLAAALPLLYRFDGRVAAARALRPLFYCGQMCYSLYLVHQLPVKAVSAALLAAGVSGPWGTLLVTVPASLVVSVALGRLFYVGVERRFLNSAPPTVEREAAQDPRRAELMPELLLGRNF